MRKCINWLRWLISPHPKKWEPFGRKISILIIRYFFQNEQKPKIPLYSYFVRSARSLSSGLILPALVLTLVVILTIWLSDNNKSTTREILILLFQEAESIALISAAAIFILEIQTRKKREHYEAWQMIVSAEGHSGSLGRIQALQDLNRDGVDLGSIDLSKGKMPGIKLSWSKLIESNFESCDLSFSDFKGSILIATNFKKSIVFGSDLRMAILSAAVFEDANLNFSSLKNATLTGVNFRGASLWGANLQGAYLDKANLEDADLRDANLAGACLKGANLKNAKFGRHPNFGVETFQIGNLGTFQMTEVSLKDIEWDEYTNWEGVTGLETIKNVPQELIEQLAIPRD